MLADVGGTERILVNGDSNLVENLTLKNVSTNFNNMIIIPELDTHFK